MVRKSPNRKIMHHSNKLLIKIIYKTINISMSFMDFSPITSRSPILEHFILTKSNSFLDEGCS